MGENYPSSHNFKKLPKTKQVKDFGELTELFCLRHNILMGMEPNYKYHLVKVEKNFFDDSKDR